MKIKYILNITLFSIVVFGIAALFIILPSKDYSMSERRLLAKMPAVSAESIADGKFMTDFEDYSLDQFPARDFFRSLKAVTVKYLFMQKDNNKLYSHDGYLSKIEYPLNKANLERNTDKLREIYNELIDGSGCKLYISVIPDKNCFLAPAGGYPYFTCNDVAQHMCSAFPEASYIKIEQLVSLEDFYRTDQHWRQENIIEVARQLCGGMLVPFSDNFTVNTLKTPFYGTYVGQAALPCKPDSICYLTNDTLNNCDVISYGTGTAKPAKMYNMEKATDKDPYEMFLGGSEPLLEINNPNAATERELVIFRDSFCSSLAPLLAEGYSKITLVDLRYMQSSILKQFIDFTDQDVLFLYSTLIMNNTIST